MNSKYIKSRTLEIDVPEKSPFENDKLEREKTATILTDIVSFYGQSGCVMALNGEWGAGKSTFVRMWKQSLINNGFKTLYLVLIYISTLENHRKGWSREIPEPVFSIYLTILFPLLSKQKPKTYLYRLLLLPCC